MQRDRIGFHPQKVEGKRRSHIDWQQQFRPKAQRREARVKPRPAPSEVVFESFVDQSRTMTNPEEFWMMSSE